MKTNKTVTLINGNGQPYELGVPKIIILGLFNDVALAHLIESTGVNFRIEGNIMKGEPTEFSQIAAIFMTYDFVTCFMNNWNEKNTIFLKPANITSETLRYSFYADTHRGKELICK